MVLIGVISDLHLGYKQYGLKQREEDFYQSTEKVFRDLSEEVDIIIISGDFIHARDLSAYKWARIKSILKLFDGKIFVITGNHDKSITGEKSWLKVMEDEGLITLIDGKSFLLPYGNCIIQGIGWKNKITIEDLPEIEHENITQYKILVCHGGVSGKLMDGLGEIDRDVLGEMNKRYDYIAAGHYHFKYEIGNFHNPGGLEYTGMNEVGKDKGYYIIDTDTRKVEWVPFQGRKFDRITLSLDELTDLKTGYEILEITVQDKIDLLKDVSIESLETKIKEQTGAMFVKVRIVPEGVGLKDIKGEVGDIFKDVIRDVIGEQDADMFTKMFDELDKGNDVYELLKEWYE